MSINYIIATYEGIIKRKYKYPPPCDTLKIHLKQLVELQHNLAQITIMKPRCDKNKYETYYDIDDIVKQIKCKVVIHECDNFGYSSGQWFLGYELYPDFDYYVFNEDDYCPNMHNFCDITLKCYRNIFPANTGLLCSYVEGEKFSKNKTLPIHWGGTIIVSNETMKKVYNCDKWNGEPRKHLDLINAKYWCGRIEKIRKMYIGAYYQLSSALMFTYSGIEHLDYLGYKYDDVNDLTFPYWNDDKGIHFYEKGKDTKYAMIHFRQNDFRKLGDLCVHSLYVPVQLLVKCVLYTDEDETMFKKLLEKGFKYDEEINEKIVQTNDEKEIVELIKLYKSNHFIIKDAGKIELYAKIFKEIGCVVSYCTSNNDLFSKYIL